MEETLIGQAQGGGDQTMCYRKDKEVIWRSLELGTEMASSDLGKSHLSEGYTTFLWVMQWRGEGPEKVLYMLRMFEKEREKEWVRTKIKDSNACFVFWMETLQTIEE